MICRRLFSVFNNNNNDEEFLSAENFIENMLNLYTGNTEYLFKLIFRIFDFNNNDNVTYEEVSLILSYIPIRHSNYDNKKFKFEQDEFIDRVQTQEDIAIALKILFSHKSFITYSDFADIIKNKNSDIFIFLLIYILERKPFSNEIIQIYKEENNSEEEEESDKEDKLEHEKDVFIKSPIINEKKLKTPQITKKDINIINKNTPSNDPIFVYKEFKDPLQREYNQKEFLKNNFNLNRAKSDDKIFLINKNNKEKDNIVIE